MIFKVELRMHTTEEGGRKVPINSGYRPTWVGNNKPMQNCGVVYLPLPTLGLGHIRNVFLQPLVFRAWDSVRIKDRLRCFEGPREVGIATVLAIYDERVLQ